MPRHDETEEERRIRMYARRATERFLNDHATPARARAAIDALRLYLASVGEPDERGLASPPDHP